MDQTKIGPQPWNTKIVSLLIFFFKEISLRERYSQLVWVSREVGPEIVCIILWIHQDGTWRNEYSWIFIFTLNSSNCRYMWAWWVGGERASDSQTVLSSFFCSSLGKISVWHQWIEVVRKRGERENNSIYSSPFLCLFWLYSKCPLISEGFRPISFKSTVWDFCYNTDLITICIFLFLLARTNMQCKL